MSEDARRGSPRADEVSPPAGDGPFPLAVARDSAPGIWKSLAAQRTRAWWIAAACILVAIALAAAAVVDRNPRIVVRFQAGHGIKPGDALRYRGIDVGRVVAVELGPDLEGMEVGISLQSKAAAVAREGSQFWIERPRVSLARISGLETVVGANYVAVSPGAADAPAAETFVGLETPPTLEEASDLEISLRFSQGHGIALGDPLKHRGIVVGEVTNVALDADLASVRVRVRLAESARPLARAGSQFWIERPQLSLTEVRGLETVVGGRYIAVLPGPENARPLTRFDGLERASPLAERGEGGLELVLEAAARGGLQAGSPVTYRGIAVGSVTSVALASDGVRVEALLYIQPDYRELVRDNSRFWQTGGIEVSMGWSGLQMDMESLSTLAAGGVSLATPDPPGAEVATGHRFVVAAEADEEWAAWQPSIPLGSGLLPGNLPLPQPRRAALEWNEAGFFGRAKPRQRDAWLLALDGRLLGPADMLSPPPEAIDGEATLAVAGVRLPLAAESIVIAGEIGSFAFSGEEAAKALRGAWPRERCRVPEAPEDCVVVGDAQTQRRPLAAGRLTAAAAGWLVDPAVPFDAAWHGAAAVSRGDGALIGLLCVDASGSRIVPLTAELLR